jgi:hypothetical protein
MVISAVDKITSQTPQNIKMVENFRNVLRELAATELADFKKELKYQPKQADHAPGMLACLWEDGHGDQGEGKWVHKLRQNPAKNSKNIHFEREISRKGFNSLTQIGGFSRPA